MKQSGVKVKQKRTKYQILLVLLMISLLILGIGGRGSGSQDDITSIVDVEPPKPLNHILTNNLSDTSTTERMDNRIKQFMRQWDIKGASIAIMKDERLIYAKGYGWADEEQNEEVEVKHIFRIASLSKLITAVAIMKLHEEKRLSLDDTIFGQNGYLNEPSFLEYRDKRVTNITIEHLLRHKSGFTTRGGDPMFSLSLISKRLGLNRAVTCEELVEYVLSQRLGFTPGTSTSYSNIGYLLLSMVIEKVTGMGYEQYVKSEILYPNGIYDMHIANNFYEQRYSNEVRYYAPSNEEPIRSFDGSGELMPRYYGGNNIRMLYGAGGWVASPVEMARFISLIDGQDNVPDLLSKESIDIMTTTGPSFLPVGWAKCNSKGWIRTGSLSGSSAIIKCNSNGYTWVFITNTSSWRGASFPKNIERFFGGVIQSVSEWPQRDLFEVETISSVG